MSGIIELTRARSGRASRIEMVGGLARQRRTSRDIAKDQAISRWRAHVEQSGHRTGGIFCDVEPEEFKAQCRVQVFPNQWNTWLIWRTLRDNPDIEDIEMTVKAVIARAMGAKGPLELGEIGFHHVEVVVGPVIESGVVPTADQIPNPFGPREKVQSLRTACPDFYGRASIVSGQYIAVMVRFVYRGIVTELPWLARRVVEAEWGPVKAGMGVWCPVEADWLLDSVYLPVAEEEVPDVPDVVDVVTEKLSDALGDMGWPELLPEDWGAWWEDIKKRAREIGKEAKSTMKIVLAGLVAVAMIALGT